MKLSPEQEEKVRGWAAEGASLSDIQARLSEEFDIHMSYLDTRLLMLDLSVSLAEKNVKKDAAPADISAERAPESTDDDGAGYAGDDAFPEEATAEEPAEEAAPAPLDEPAGEPQAANVKVELSRIQRPGFAVSGTIVCTDGTAGEWAVTQDGRIAMDFGENKGYRPTAADVRDFQLKVRDLLMNGF